MRKTTLTSGPSMLVEASRERHGTSWSAGQREEAERVGAHAGLIDWVGYGWAFVGGRKGAAQRLEDRGRREQAGRCGPKVRWAAVWPAGQRKWAGRRERDGSRTAGWAVVREREKGKEKNPFLLFQNLFQNHFKSNLNHFEF